MGANHLLRVLGLAFGFAAVVGGIIGQGILRAPGTVALASSSTWVILGLWLLGAVLTMVLALPYAELGAAIPRAGGEIAYAERAFSRPGFIAVSMMLTCAWIVSLAMVTYVLGEYLVRLGIGTGLGAGVMGAAGMVVFFFLNAIGTRSTGAIQIGFAAVKGAMLIALVVVLFGQDPVEAMARPAAEGGWRPLATAMLLIFGAYNGWSGLVVYGEELENPARTVVRSLFGGIAGVAVIFLLINAAILHVIPPAALAGSEFAAADAARGVFGQSGDFLFTLFGVVSVAAIGNLMLMNCSRMVYSLARAGLAPAALASVRENGAPVPALLAAAVIAGLLILSGTYLTLAAASVAMTQAVFLLTAIATISLRRREPDLARPFRIPAFPLAIGVVIAINLVLLAVFIAQDPVHALAGFALVAVLTLAYSLRPDFGVQNR